MQQRTIKAKATALGIIFFTAISFWNLPCVCSTGEAVSYEHCPTEFATTHTEREAEIFASYPPPDEWKTILLKFCSKWAKMELKCPENEKCEVVKVFKELPEILRNIGRRGRLHFPSSWNRWCKEAASILASNSRVRFVDSSFEQSIGTVLTVALLRILIPATWTRTDNSTRSPDDVSHTEGSKPSSSTIKEFSEELKRLREYFTKIHRIKSNLDASRGGKEMFCFPDIDKIKKDQYLLSQKLFEGLVESIISNVNGITKVPEHSHSSVSSETRRMNWALDGLKEVLDSMVSFEEISGSAPSNLRILMKRALIKNKKRNITENPMRSAAERSKKLRTEASSESARLIKMAREKQTSEAGGSSGASSSRHRKCSTVTPHVTEKVIVDVLKTFLKPRSTSTESAKHKVQGLVKEKNQLPDELRGLVSKKGSLSFLGLNPKSMQQYVWPQIKKIESSSVNTVVVRSTSEIFKVYEDSEKSNMINKNFRTIPFGRLDIAFSEENLKFLQIAARQKVLKEKSTIWYELIVIAMKLSLLLDREAIVVQDSIFMDNSDGLAKELSKILDPITNIPGHLQMETDKVKAPITLFSERAGVLVIKATKNGIEIRKYSTKGMAYVGEHLCIKTRPLEQATSSQDRS